MQSEKNHLCGRVSLFQCTGGIQAAHAGHREIHHDQVGIEGVGLFECVHTVHGFLNNERGVHFEGRPYDQADDLIVVYD